MPFNCIFYCGSFDIYHSGLAGSALFFVPVYIVNISTVAGGTKFERFLPKNQQTQRKLLKIDNWVNGELSKIGHHFRKQSASRIEVS